MRKNKLLYLMYVIIIVLLIPLVSCSKKSGELSGVVSSSFYYSENIAENGFWDGIRANDYVNVDKYKALPIPSDVHKISDEAIQSEIDDILAFYSASELTDDFVVANLSNEYGWASVSELKEGLLLDLQKQAIILYVEQYLSTEETTQPIPDHLLAYIERAMIEEYRTGAEDNEMELEQFLANTVGVSSEDELLTKYREGNIATAVYSLVAQAIAENVGISVSKEDMDDFFSMNFGFDDYSLFEERYGLPFLKQITLYKKVVEYVAENAVLE